MQRHVVLKHGYQIYFYLHSKYFLLLVFNTIVQFINFKNKMLTKELPLFTLDLCIQKKAVKLRVHEADTLNDLLVKLVNKINLPQKYIDKVQEKLQAELRRMAKNQTCSSKVQDKLQSLAKECQIVILGVSQSDPVEPSLNETPFNILLETPGKAKKGSIDTGKRNYLQSGQGSPALKRNYNLPVSQIRYKWQNAQNYNCEPNHKNTATFSSIPYKQASSHFPSPQKCFKRYGINSQQNIESYGMSFGMSFGNVNGYQICNERGSGEMKNQVTCMDYGLRSLDNRPIFKKYNQVANGYITQKNKNEGYFDMQSYTQYLNNHYGACQPTSLNDQSSKIQIPQKPTNTFIERSPESGYGKIGKKFSYLQQSQF